MIYLVNLKKWGGGLKPPAPSAPPLYAAPAMKSYLE